MPEIDIETIKRRSVRGVTSLTLARFALRTVSFLGSVFLARLLTPEIFGIFTIVSFVITFFSFFSDVGLGAALIQKKGQLTEKELKTTFFIQNLLVGLLVLIAFLAAPFIAARYQLEASGVWLIRALSLSLVLTSLKSIPSIKLERSLKFTRLLIPEAVEVIVYQIAAVALAFFGFGVWSFILAILVRGLLGTILIYVLSPWPIGFAYDGQITKKLITFGLAYQSNYFLALIKDAVMPVFVGLAAGAAAVGYLNWAMMFSTLPMMPIQTVFRVTFPMFSRIQGDKNLVRKALQKSINLINLTLFPAVFLLMATAEPIVHFVYTDKWLPALPAFYIHSFGVLVTGVNTTLYNAFWALGEVRSAIKLMIISTLINWLVSVPLVYLIGFNGAMVGSVVVLYVSLPLSIILMRRVVKIDIFSNVWPQFLAGLISGIITFYLGRVLINNLPTLLLTLLIGGVIYLMLVWITSRGRMFDELKWVLSKVK